MSVIRFWLLRFSQGKILWFKHDYNQPPISKTDTSEKCYIPFTYQIHVLEDGLSDNGHMSSSLLHFE